MSVTAERTSLAWQTVCHTASSAWRGGLGMGVTLNSEVELGGLVMGLALGAP